MLEGRQLFTKYKYNSGRKSEIFFQITRAYGGICAIFAANCVQKKKNSNRRSIFVRKLLVQIVKHTVKIMTYIYIVTLKISI